MMANIRLTDHVLDNLNPILPLWHVVEDLYSTDPTKQNLS